MRKHFTLTPLNPSLRNHFTLTPLNPKLVDDSWTTIVTCERATGQAKTISACDLVLTVSACNVHKRDQDDFSCGNHRNNWVWSSIIAIRYGAILTHTLTPTTLAPILLRNSGAFMLKPMCHSCLHNDNACAIFVGPNPRNLQHWRASLVDFPLIRRQTTAFRSAGPNPHFSPYCGENRISP